MYWTPAKMQLFADVGKYSFANAGIEASTECKTFLDDIFKFILLNQKFVFWFKFHYFFLFLWVTIMISQPWFI